MAFGEFLGAALDIGEDIFSDVSEFVSDIGLEDLATIATTGVALSQLFSQPEAPSVPQTKASQLGATIASQEAEAPEVVLGAGEEDDTNRRATQAGLRVRRTFTPGAGLGAGANPLSIQI